MNLFLCLQHTHTAEGERKEMYIYLPKIIKKKYINMIQTCKRGKWSIFKISHVNHNFINKEY